MRIHEIEAREDYTGILRQTLSEGWSVQFDQPIAAQDSGRGQVWRQHRFFSAIVGPHPSPRVRRFLVRHMQWTPFRKRVVPQFFASHLLGARAPLRLSSSRILVADPPVPHAQELLVLPGNRRIRVLDFECRETWTFVKPGFDTAANLNEARVRRGTGPFLPVTAVADDGSWLREPLLTGVPLPRVPPWRSRGAIVREVVDALVAFQAKSEEHIPAETYHSRVRASIEAGIQRARRVHPQAPWDNLTTLVGRLVSESGQQPVRTVTSHGDLQAGNIFVRPELAPLLIDWEYAARRFAGYDLAVLDLGLRHSDTMFGPLAALLEPSPRAVHTTRHHGAELSSLHDRRAFTARIALEELNWLLEGAGDQAITQLPKPLLGALHHKGPWPF